MPVYITDAGADHYLRIIMGKVVEKMGKPAIILNTHNFSTDVRVWEAAKLYAERFDRKIVIFTTTEERAEMILNDIINGDYDAVMKYDIKVASVPPPLFIGAREYLKSVLRQ